MQLENQRIFLKEKFILIHSHLKRLVVTSVKVLRARFVFGAKPLSSSLPLGTLADLARSKPELVAENALLRQQLIILKRQVKRPACTKKDRILLVLLAKAVRDGQTPRYLIRDNDNKFGPCFARVAATSAIEILKTPYHAPRANAVCERFLRSVRQECLDHLLILREKQLQRMLKQYVTYFNRARPHQGIQQQIPESFGSSSSSPYEGTWVMAIPILAGLHHDYQWVA